MSKKPAPDAMRKALLRACEIITPFAKYEASVVFQTVYENAPENLYVMRNSDEHNITQITVADFRATTAFIKEIALSLAPVPPGDGATTREEIARHGRNYAASAVSACIAVADEIGCAKGSAQDIANALRERFPSDAGAAEPVGWRWSEMQIHFAARALALSNPDAYEDKTHKGSLQPNQKAIDAACMALGAAIRHGAAPVSGRDAVIEEGDKSNAAKV